MGKGVRCHFLAFKKKINIHVTVLNVYSLKTLTFNRDKARSISRSGNKNDLLKSIHIETVKGSLTKTRVFYKNFILTEIQR